MARHIADDHQEAAVAPWLDVEEIAAHFGCWVVDGVHFVAGRIQLFAGNHQLLDTARRGKLALGVFSVMLDTQEPNKDDQHNGQQSGEVGNRSKVNRNRPSLYGERGAVGMTRRVADKTRHDWLSNTNNRKHKRNEQETGLKITANGCRNQGDENKQRPTNHPQHGAQTDENQCCNNEPTMTAYQE